MLWIANLAILIGMWMLGYKWRHSFLFSIFGEALYTYWSFANDFIELGVICIVFCLVAFRNWWKWRDSAESLLQRSQEDVRMGRLHSHEEIKRMLDAPTVDWDNDHPFGHGDR